MNPTLTPENFTKRHFDLGLLDWTLSGFWPTAWKGKSMELGFAFETEFPPMPVQVPGSVQQALRNAGHLPDWSEGLNSRLCEWVEHREWMFSAELPDVWFKAGRRFILNCGGLDGIGVVISTGRKWENSTTRLFPTSSISRKMFRRGAPAASHFLRAAALVGPGRLHFRNEGMEAAL